MPPTTFSKFSSLPADIRRGIWERAAQSPSIHFFSLSRGTEDIVRLKQLTDEALRQYARAQGPSWHQLSWNEKRMKDYDVNDPMIGNYRASLVGLAPLAPEDRARLAGRTASWQREDLASVCTESWRTVREQLARLSGGTNMHTLVAPFVQPHNIICLGMPKPARRPMKYDGFPVFEETSFPSCEMGCPYGHQTVALPRTNCPPEFNPERFDFDRRSTKYHPTLQQACPELATLEKIAFIFEPREALESVFPERPPWSRRHMTTSGGPMAALFGVDALWPHNLHALQEIYFIDSSISPKDGAQLLLKSMPSFAGNGVNFYEVDPKDTHIWDITTTDGALKPVFEEAKNVQEHYKLQVKNFRYVDIYRRHSNLEIPPVLVKVLACVPPKRRDAAQPLGNRPAILELSWEIGVRFVQVRMG